jgi:hypothetical protein
MGEYPLLIIVPYLALTVGPSQTRNFLLLQGEAVGVRRTGKLFKPYDNPRNAG